jgi:SAM-dependent methyltransferase
VRTMEATKKMAKIPSPRTGVRYVSNLAARVADEEGFAEGLRAGVSFLAGEAAKLPAFARILLDGSARAAVEKPVRYSDDLRDALAGLDAEFRPFTIDADAFRRHVEAHEYPANYAAGPVDEGGAREKKLIEYFASLDLLDVQPGDLVIDVASERSLFPRIVQRIVDCTVYRQDLIYPPGVHGNRIDGSAAAMPVPDAWADRLVLHNSFEHFEGSADTGFVEEVARVLKPGGVTVIVPLFVAEQYMIVTDPLVDRDGIVWDEGARVVETPWAHNRFGRFYDVASLTRRVLEPAGRVGLEAVIHHFVNIKDVHPRATMHFGLVLRKPGAGGSGKAS